MHTDFNMSPGCRDVKMTSLIFFGSVPLDLLETNYSREHSMDWIDVDTAILKNYRTFY